MSCASAAIIGGQAKHSSLSSTNALYQRYQTRFTVDSGVQRRRLRGHGREELRGDRQVRAFFCQLNCKRTSSFVDEGGFDFSLGRPTHVLCAAYVCCHPRDLSSVSTKPLSLPATPFSKTVTCGTVCRRRRSAATFPRSVFVPT